jgi:hypothetical protein
VKGAAPDVTAVVQDKIRGRRLIFLGPTLAPSAAKAAELGAAVMLVCPRGWVPDGFEGEVVDIAGAELKHVMIGGMGGLETWSVLDEAKAATPLRRRLDDEFRRFDAARRAIVVAPSSATLGDEFDGRVVWGSRRPGIDVLEDKTRVDALVFDPAEVARVPGETFPVHHGAFDKAFALYDEGVGLVLSVDGVTISSQSTRFVVSPGQARQECRLLSRPDGGPRTARLATMKPWTSGTVAFMNFPDGQVLTFSPVENMVAQMRGADLHSTSLEDQRIRVAKMLHDHTGFDLEYELAPFLRMVGLNNVWQPTHAALSDMRRNAGATGKYVLNGWRYFGAGGVDQVVSNRRALAHELNPRFAYGLVLLDQALPPDIPLGLFNAMLVSSDEIWGPNGFPHINGLRLQEVVRDAATRPIAQVGLPIEKQYGNRNWRYRYANSKFRVADLHTEGALVVIRSSTNDHGHALKFTGLEHVAQGRSLTPIVASLFDMWAADEYYPDRMFPASAGPHVWETGFVQQQTEPTGLASRGWVLDDIT